MRRQMFRTFGQLVVMGTIVVAARVASAQPAEKPPLGQEVTGEVAREAGEVDGAHEGGAHEEHDPTKHFNFTNFGYLGKDVAGGPMGDDKNGSKPVGEEGEEKMSPPFVLMIVNFLIFMGILAWKLRPAANKLAMERHDQIKTALEEAAKLRNQAADKLAEYEAKLKDADAEITRMVDGMRKDAEADKARILDNAAKQAAQMKHDAEQRIAAEIEVARAVLTREVTAAATAATEKILRDQVQPMDQSRLVSSFITDVQSQQPKERV